MPTSKSEDKCDTDNDDRSLVHIRFSCENPRSASACLSTTDGNNFKEPLYQLFLTFRICCSRITKEFSVGSNNIFSFNIEPSTYP